MNKKELLEWVKASIPEDCIITNAEIESQHYESIPLGQLGVSEHVNLTSESTLTVNFIKQYQNKNPRA